MKIADLRALLANASTDDLLKILSELYKRIPKSLKEAPVDGVDIAIKAILSHQDIGKKAQKSKTIDFDSLHDQITTFLDYADEGYYISPNRVVPKAQRSKWRFLVMGFIKDIQKIGLNDENYENKWLVKIESSVDSSASLFINLASIASSTVISTSGTNFGVAEKFIIFSK